MVSTQLEKQIVETGYKPRAVQQYLHTHLKRFNVIVAHRRMGKTIFTINEMIDQAVHNIKHRNPQYAYIGPNYGQVKRIAWDYLKEYTKTYPDKKINEAELRIDLYRPNFEDRVRFMLLGAENPASLRGIYLDGVIMDEFAEMDPTIWSQVVRPALADRLGWAIFIGTPKGMNHFHEVFQHGQKAEGWTAHIFKASQTQILPQSELKDAKAIMTEEEYNQEFECSFQAALVGAYFGKQMDEAERDGRITEVAYDPAIRVDTWWDLGVADATAIWFTQTFSGMHRVIDYYEASGQDLAHYVKVLEDKDYIYGDCTIPHDGAARSLETGRTRQEVLRSLGVNAIVQRLHRKQDQINAARMIIPKCIFDAKKCEKGLNALRNYQRKWDSINKIFSETPLHNWSSHGADAFQVFSMGVREDHNRFRDLPKKAITDYNVFDI